MGAEPTSLQVVVGLEAQPEVSRTLTVNAHLVDLRASRSRLDGDLHLAVGPAALEAAAALSGIIVDGDVQQVLAGLAEGGGGGRFPAEGDVRAFRFLDLGLFPGEG